MVDEEYRPTPLVSTPKRDQREITTQILRRSDDTVDDLPETEGVSRQLDREFNNGVMACMGLLCHRGFSRTADELRVLMRKVRE